MSLCHDQWLGWQKLDNAIFSDTASVINVKLYVMAVLIEPSCQFTPIPLVASREVKRLAPGLGAAYYVSAVWANKERSADC